MGAGSLVGRVGGLAVLLGVGIAIAGGSGVALADEVGSGSSEGSPGPAAADKPTAGSGGDTSTTGDSTRTSKKRTDKKSKDADEGNGENKVDVNAAAESPTRSGHAREAAPGQDADADPDIVSLTVSDPQPVSPPQPVTPVDSPVALALLAIGSRSRTAGEAAIDDIPTDESSPALAMTARVGSVPNVPEQRVGAPDPQTGVVNGAVIATKPDGMELTYAVVEDPTKGTVQVNPQTGAYTYSPTQAARLAAGATTSADTDSFRVAVGAGQQSTTVRVSVYVSPLRFGSRTPVSVGGSPSAMAVSGDGRIYVANTSSRSVSVIDTATGRRIDANTNIFSTNISVGSSPSALALSADGKLLYVANSASGSVSVIDTATYRRLDTDPSVFRKDIAVGSSPAALALGPEGRLYVANRSSNTVSVVDTVANKLVDTAPNMAGIQAISTGSAPSALAFSGSRLYIANRDADTVTVVDMTNYSVVATVAVGHQPVGAALSTAGLLYVANRGSNSVSVIDTATNTLADNNTNSPGVNSIPTGASPSSVAFSPSGGLAFVSNAGGTLTVLDTVTRSVVSTAVADSDTSGGYVVAVGSDGTVYVTDARDRTVRRMAIERGNTAPIAGPAIVGVPDPETGAVRVEIGMVDPDGDPLGWGVSVAGTIDSTDPDAFIFTPTDAAREAAAKGGATSTTFTVEVTDNQLTTPVRVTVPIAPALGPTGVTKIGEVAVPGFRTSGPASLSADGSRALITMYSTDFGTPTVTRTVVIDSATGKQLGAAFTLAGSPSGSLLSQDGTRTVITTTRTDATGTATMVAVVNASSGQQIGTTTVLSGANSLTTLSADGRRALVTTAAGSSTRVAVFDTVTGVPISTSFQLTGSLSSGRLWGVDGSRVLIATYVQDPSGFTTRVAVVNAGNGAQVGSTTTLAGYGVPMLSSDGSRAVLATAHFDSAAGVDTTRVAVIDIGSGNQIGTPTTVVGFTSGTRLLNANASRVLLIVNDTKANRAQVIVVDTVTGTHTASVTLPGTESFVSPSLGAGGSRLLVATYARDEVTGGYSTHVAVIDAGTGDPTTATLTFAGEPYGASLLGADRVLICTALYDSRTSTNTMRLSVVDIGTGGQLGGTVTLAGFMNLGPLMVSPDGKRAVIASNSYDTATGTSMTRVAVMDTTTGTQIGSTHSQSGNGYALMSADGRRALIVTTGTSGTQATVINTATGRIVGVPLTIAGGISSTPLLSADGRHAVITTLSGLTPSTLTTRVITLQIG